MEEHIKHIPLYKVKKLAFTGVVLMDTDCDWGTKIVWNTSTEIGNSVSDLGIANGRFRSKEEFLKEIENRSEHQWAVVYYE